jgi:hypothetical protein
MGTYCGIDVGERKLFAAAIGVDDARVVGVQFAETESVEEVIGWVADRGSVAVGIDAPPGPNLGFLNDPGMRQALGITTTPENTDRRVAEYRLGIGGCYSTRSEEGAASGWMRTGFRVYSELERRTGLQIDRGTCGAIFEIHPTYGFRSLLGVERNGDRLRCDPCGLLRPKNPRGCPGHRQRIEMLASLLAHFGMTTDDSLKARLEGSVDRTDALLGALLGFLRDRDRTISVGIYPEGAIHLVEPTRLGELADRLKREVRPAHLVDPTRLAALTVQTLPDAERPARRDTARDATGFLLRLGQNAFGRLSQQQTIDIALGMLSYEGRAIIPLNLKKILPDTINRSRSEGLTVLVGYSGRLILEFQRARIEGEGATEPTSSGQIFGNDPNPWPGIEAAPYWLASEAVRELDDDDCYDSIETWRAVNREWERGVPLNQCAWLRFRRPVTV